ncbi:hypothetical protein [Treponema sp. OMZ 855]|uniref:hypothetical protein n=1 Tax=Treponema sp. OMZ 855 TaxID=1643512 RepID=UPI0020A36193|nr:hypothetical protein [Treponema sp. OMZ 855]UTC51807.1 hypothetical protein E4N65_05680 [Treponema sp. OMZ 855]
MKQNKTNTRARGGVTVICFLVMLIGQFYLLRNVIHTESFSFIMMPWSAELFFALVLIAAIIYLFIQPMGWYTKRRLAAAFILLIAYSALTISYYEAFKTAYLTGASFEYASSAGGLVGLKLVLAVVGVTAGIPVAQSIDGREYAKRLREKVEKNNAQLTKETASGAQQDLIRTINKLRETMSPEELAAFLKELKSADIETVCNSATPVDISSAPADSDATSLCSASEAQTPLAEKWRGWGGGV